MKKTLLVAINAKFIHSNLALRYIKKYYAQKEQEDILLLREYSINHDVDFILREILLEAPEVVAFSCYLWNIEFVRKLSYAIKSIDPKVTIIYGGPEVSYTSKNELIHNTSVDYIISGEGEEVFRKLTLFLNGLGDFPSFGLSYRNEDIVQELPTYMGLNMDELPFPYDEELEGLENRILYYETSRGCPFNCQYCLSSIEKGVRFKSLSIVYKELDFFLKKQVRQVKLVDRTFNTKKDHALSIMNYIIEGDNGITNFHFEVAPELIGEEFIECLAKAREGLFQLEIGVQSSHSETLEIIQRKNHLPKIEEAVSRVKQLGNTHMHLDLIAGLPKENYLDFGKSFDYVYSLAPDQLQLGFLKVLKGSGMMAMKEKYGIIYRDYPPYEVLQTDALSFKELERLKVIEEMVELFYNSGQFQMTVNSWISSFSSPFIGYEYLADQWISKNMHLTKHQKLDLYQFLYDVCQEKDNKSYYSKQSLMFDYCLNEKPKKKADWMDYHLVDSSIQRLLLDELEAQGIWADENSLYTTKQRSRMFHIDEVSNRVLPSYFDTAKVIKIQHETYKGDFILINYQRRDFIHNNGDVVIIKIEELLNG